MTDNVVTLEGRKIELGADSRVIELLQHLLQDAESGHLQGIALVGFSRDGFLTFNWVGETKDTELLGGIERLKYEILRAVEEYDK